MIIILFTSSQLPKTIANVFAAFFSFENLLSFLLTIDPRFFMNVTGLSGHSDVDAVTSLASPAGPKLPTTKKLLILYMAHLRSRMVSIDSTFKLTRQRSHFHGPSIWRRCGGKAEPFTPVPVGPTPMNPHP